MEYLEQTEFDHHISLTEYTALRQSVDFVLTTPERATVALHHSLYLRVARINGEAVGMARVVGDGGYVFFICDVIVNPSYQSHGIGRALIEQVLADIEADVNSGETVMVNLMSAIGKEAFYEKHGFHRRPFGNHGAGMSRWIRK